MFNQRPSAFICGFIASFFFSGFSVQPSAFAVDLASTERWNVDTGRLVPHNIEIRRGDTRYLEPTFLSAGSPLDLSAATNGAVYFIYKTTASSNIYCAAGSVLVATNGTVRVPWTTAQETIADNLLYDLIVCSPSSGIVRCYGNITLSKPVGHVARTNNPAVFSLPLIFGTGLATDLASFERWYVDTERLTPHSITIRRGETRFIEPTFRSYGSPLDLSGATSVLFQYKSLGMTNYYCATGAVLVATNGTIRVPWTTAQETITNTLSYDLVVSSASSSVVRCYGSLSLVDSVPFNGVVTNNPVYWTSAFGDMFASIYDPTGIKTSVVFSTDSRLADARQPLAHNQAWSTITNTPHSLSEYGITNQSATGGGADSSTTNYIDGATNTLQGRLSTHTNRTDNPHAVTLAQVGGVDATVTNAHAQLNGTAAHGLGSISTRASNDFVTTSQTQTLGVAYSANSGNAGVAASLRESGSGWWTYGLNSGGHPDPVPGDLVSIESFTVIGDFMYAVRLTTTPTNTVHVLSAASAAHATSADEATVATWAGSSTNANQAAQATVATWAGNATNAAQAVVATQAGFATNANTAATAAEATVATQAGSATNAQQATVATVSGTTSNLTPALSNVVFNMSNGTNWPSVFTPYTISFATSNDVNYSNGNFQFYAPTNTTTIYLPIMTLTNMCSLRLDVYRTNTSFTVSTNNVLITTNDQLGVGAANLNIRTQGVTTLLFDKAYNTNHWRVFGL